jgi:glucose-6-phosphate-specific signal transduction histidine kinase
MSGGTSRSQQTDPSGSSDLLHRLAGMLEGLTIERVVRADGNDLVIDMTDGTRLIVNAPEKLDISVT